MAELNINERLAGDVTVLDMSGKITIGEGSVALRTAVRRLLEDSRLIARVERAAEGIAENEISLLPFTSNCLAPEDLTIAV